MIIPAILRVFDPGVVACDAPRWKQRRWVRQSIGPPPQADQPEYTAWRRSVALALIGGDAGTAQGDRNPHGPRRKPTARLGARSRRHANHPELA
jgi:hypothetical protein